MFNVSITPTVKNILIINILLFGVNLVVASMSSFHIGWALSLHPLGSESFQVYQIFSYVFIQHSIINLALSSLTLYFMGSSLEQMWGAKKFLNFYIISSICTAICILFFQGAYSFIKTGSFIPMETSVVSAGFEVYSGMRWIIFNLLTAIVLTMPDVNILLYFIIPIKVKYLWFFAVIMEAIQFFLNPSYNGVDLWTMLVTSIVTYFLLKNYVNKSRYF